MIDRVQNLALPPCNIGRCSPLADDQGQVVNPLLTQPADTVRISKQGREQVTAQNAGAAGLPGEAGLDPEQKREVDKLEQTDREVKAHERDHMAAGAGLVMGGANYKYQRGPDGKIYAVEGEVKIDTSREREPKDTIRKMQQVKRAALAPSQPSGQDRNVAARASQIEAEARIELLKENSQKAKQNGSSLDKSNGILPTGIRNAYYSFPNEPTLKITV